MLLCAYSCKRNVYLCVCVGMFVRADLCVRAWMYVYESLRACTVVCICRQYIHVYYVCNLAGLKYFFLKG